MPFARLFIPVLAFVVGSSGVATAQPKAATERIVFAGGCFWGVQAVFDNVRGVTKAVAGYAGGQSGTAHYEIVSTGLTGHAESVQVTYDPAKISLETLLDVYFTVAHDPTELNYQGPDHGTQYRSEIFTTTAAQAQLAAATIKRLDAAHVYRAPIVTKVEPLHGFYAAEAYHQHYLVKHRDEPYIQINDLPKLAALKEKFPRLIAAR